MTGESDNKDKNESRKIAIAMIALLVVLLVVIALLVPSLSDLVQTELTPGLGPRTAAIIAFGVTFTTLVVFAIASGDGLLGELQFIIPGFFLFFLFFWLMTAWIF